MCMRTVYPGQRSDIISYSYLAVHLELVGADITQRWIYVRDYNVKSASGIVWNQLAVASMVS